MNPENQSHMNPQQSVLYHCACGAQLVLNPNVGGSCIECKKNIPPKLLTHDLGLTVELGEDHFQLDQTLPLNLVPEHNGANTIPRTDESGDPEKLVGEMFGHFKLVSPLGRGGMGQVYRALDTSLQRFAAVKLLRSGIEGPSESKIVSPNGGSNTGSSDKEIDKLLQEAVSQARVSHPNIVTIYYVGKQNGNPFLAMELVNGRPMSQDIDRADVPFDEIVSVALDITNALKFSYELDIIHGDIKPSNVLISKNGTAKLSDFGMARSASNDTDESVGGTPNYIAPEILKGEKPSLQSDIYALGVSLFEYTFGKLPRELTRGSISHWVEILESSQLEFPTPWPGRLPEKWKLVLNKMLAIDPDERYQTYESLLSDLHTIQPGSKVPARLLPRLVATGFDWATVLSLAVVVQVALSSPAWASIGEQILGPVSSFTTINESVLVGMLKALNFLPIIGYTALIYLWRQSIGRNLMHIRVVNQFGMRPSRKQMLIRSAFRMQFPFVVMCRLLYQNLDSGLIYVVIRILLVLSMLFLLLDIAYIILFSINGSVHDAVAKTRVVLDTRQPVKE